MQDPTANDTADASRLFAEQLAGLSFEALGSAAIDIAKKSILDTVAVCLAASSLNEDTSRLAQIATGSGGNCTVLGFGSRTSAPMAAWVNGGLAHALDFDDIAYDDFAHPSGALVPALFALAEQVGDISGREFLAAVALGQDMVVRLSAGLDWKAVAPLTWLPFPLVGVFAAAGGCARLLRLDSGKTQSAIGAALAHCAGAGELQFGSLRGLYDAWAAHGGVLSALMAQCGIRGPVQALEGRQGFFSVYWQRSYDRERLLDGLGSRFLGERTGYKAWPSCAVTHPAIDATLKLVERHDIRPDDIERVMVRVSPAALPQCNPLEEKRRPATVMDAKFSVPFTVALACCTRGVRLRDFTPAQIVNAPILALAQRVTPIVDGTLEGQRGVDPSEVEIHLKSGAVHVERTSAVYGHHTNPMDLSAVAEKFRECAAMAVQPPLQESIEAFIHQVTRLEELDDMSILLRTLYPEAH